jgi:Fe-S-cluster containining protein
MSNEEFLCARCARHMKTCCQTPEVYVTPGDVDRIADHIGRRDFFHFRVPTDAAYLEEGDDPVWQKYVFHEDKTRRVLKRMPDGDCSLLGPQGCTLPLEVRPLVCRLYPYDYDERGIRDEPTPGCPIELLRPGMGLMEELDLKLEDARRWHKQLYAEILLEKESQPMPLDTGTGFHGREPQTACSSLTISATGTNE